jgi:hypothetical protein
LGCAHPAIRDLSLVPPVTPHAARACTIQVAPLIDARPEMERMGGKQTSLTLLVPYPMLWLQSSAGFRLHNPETIGGPRLLEDLRAGLEATIRDSGLCRIAAPGETPTHVLEGRLVHLYGVGYTRSAFKDILFFYVTNDIQAFLPAGQVSLELVLRSGSGARTIDLDAQAISDPSVDGTPMYADTEDQSSAVVMRATLEAYAALPAELAQALSRVDDGATADPGRFRILRLSADRSFVEIATIDRSTHTVLEDVVAQRLGPIYSEPGEWVLAREQPERLSRRAYLELVQTLSREWDLRIEGNLSAARFLGLKNGPIRR